MTSTNTKPLPFGSEDLQLPEELRGQLRDHIQNLRTRFLARLGGTGWFWRTSGAGGDRSCSVLDGSNHPHWCQYGFDYRSDLSRATDSFRVIVPEEAVGERCELLHTVNLLVIDIALGDVMPADDVIAQLASLQSS